MEVMGTHRTFSSVSGGDKRLFGSWIKILIILKLLLEVATGLQLHTHDHHVVMDNGILQVTLSNPEGMVTGIRYDGIPNLLEAQNGENNRGYWDLVWKIPGKISKRKKGTRDRIEATKFKVIVQNMEQIELSFARTWNLSLENETVPLNVDKRFVMLNGSSGFYTYAIFERLEGWPASEINNIRLAFKLSRDKFRYMAISEDRQRYMPLPDDRLPGRGRALAYPEAVRLVRPIEPEFRGEVDDKYQYSCESKDIKVHGWISTDAPSSVGFWQITPSNEFRSAGPTKQFLTSHVGPTSLSVFHSTHYAGADLIMKFENGEKWKKVFGPVFIYLNSVLNGDDPLVLWEDAKKQMMIEARTWPYRFPASKDFPSSDHRGKVTGRLLVKDRFFNDKLIPASGSYVGLARPGKAGSWQREYKGYQFWTKADSDGHFVINDVRTGEYYLYLWVPGFIGDYRYETSIHVAAGSDISVGELVYKPPRHGPTLWEIGVPDRSAAEFYVPDPNPTFINRLYQNHSDRFRQYGLWERYAELYADADLVFTVGVDDYHKDWFFEQVTRKRENNTYEGTTWQIKFMLNQVDTEGTYKLRVALATANVAELQIRINNPRIEEPPLFSSGQIGRDNTIARHGVHGLYWNYNVDVPGKFCHLGENTLFFMQTLSQSPFQGIMYDYIRFEGPNFRSS